MEGTESTATPASTAPATSGAPSGDTARPTTFAQAFASNPVESVSPADTPATEPVSVEQPASATTAPTEPIAAATPALTGTIPTQRHKEILDGVYKERDAVRQELASLRQQFDSPEHQQLTRWQQSFLQSPEGWIEQTFSELAARHPEKVPQFRSVVARILASRTPAPDTSMDPDIPVYNERGEQVAQTFSADKVRAIVAHAVNEALQREVGPLKQDATQRQQAEQIAKMQREAQKTAAEKFEAAKAWPGFFVDPAKGIVDPDAIKAFEEHADWDLRDVYLNVVLPKREKARDATREAEVLDTLKQKAAATSVSPSGAAVATTRKPTSLLDKSLSWS